MTTLVDLSDMTPASLGDMVIDELGRAYVGAQAFQGGVAGVVEFRNETS